MQPVIEMKTIVAALKRVFALRPYRLVGAISFAGFLALYLITLPASFTGGRIGLVALRFLDAKLTLLSVLMAALAGLITSVIVYLLKQEQKTSKASATGGLIVGVLTPLLCCSPILPIALGFIASTLPSLVGTFGWGLQGFIATHQTELFLTAALLLVFALYQNAKRVVERVHCRVLPAVH